MDNLITLFVILGIAGIAVPIFYTGKQINKTLSTMSNTANESLTATKGVSQVSSNKLLTRIKEGNYALSYNLCSTVNNAIKKEPVNFEEIIRDGTETARKIYQEEIDSEVEIKVGSLSVSEIMTPIDLIDAIDEDDGIEKLYEFILKYKHMGYPVIDNRGNLKGIVAFGDLSKVKRERWKKTKVKSIMTPKDKLITANPAEPAFDAVQRMIRKDKGRLPVIENENLVGIISRSDSMKVFKRLLS